MKLIIFHVADVTQFGSLHGCQVFWVTPDFSRLPLRWRYQFYPKRWYSSTKLHGVTYNKTVKCNRPENLKSYAHSRLLCSKAYQLRNFCRKRTLCLISVRLLNLAYNSSSWKLPDVNMDHTLRVSLYFNVPHIFILWPCKKSCIFKKNNFLH